MSDDAALRTDALVCVLPRDDPAAHRNCFRFLRQSIDRFPYIPAVVVGATGDHCRRFKVLGASRLLPAATDAASILRQTLVAVETTWWSGVSECDLPALVVDETGVIVRANDAAMRRLGPDLLGHGYSCAVELAQSPELPADHPIREVLGPAAGAAENGRQPRQDSRIVPAAAARYVEYNRPDSDVGRAHIACVSIVSLRNVARAAAVLFVDINVWTQTIRAASEFARQESADALYESIVREVANLGYKRARLYEYLEKEGKLVGRASVGLSDDRAAAFREGFTIPVDQDEPSADTIASEFPTLWHRQDPKEGFLTRISPAKYQDELEHHGINRWIEVPLRVPLAKRDGTATVRCWGKLSVDDGPDSDRLNIRDVTDLGLFSTVAGAALASIPSRQDHRHLDILRRYSEEMAEATRQVADIRPRMIGLLLQMYLEITGADVTFFRELRAGLLSLEQEPQWRERKIPSDVQVPREKRKGEVGSSRVLDFVAADGSFNEEHVRPPFVLRDAQEPIRKMVCDSAHDRWTKEERAFLQRVGAEACIPVVIQGRLRGVVVAIYWDARAFPSGLDVVLSRFMYTAKLWFQFAELHARRLMLGSVMAVLPELAGAETEEGFYAAVAAILSLHLGIGWNRVLVFDCQGHVPDTAELVYAIGGLGDEKHNAVMDQVKREKKNLREFVRERIQDPIPRGWSESLGFDSTDPVYRTYVQDLPKDRRIRIDFGRETSARIGRWLNAVLLSPDLKNLPLTIIPLYKEDAAFQEVKQAYPGLLVADKSYVLPIWRTSDYPRRELLALVIVDQFYRPGEDVIDMLFLTRASLDLVGDIMTFRANQRTLSGFLGALPTFGHRTGLKKYWDLFYPEIDTLMCQLEEVGGVEEVCPPPAATLSVRPLQFGGVLHHAGFRVAAMAFPGKLLECVLHRRPCPVRAIAVDPQLGGQLIGGLKADPPDVVGKLVGVGLDLGNGLLAVGPVDPRSPRRADAMLGQEQHDPADLFLFLPALANSFQMRGTDPLDVDKKVGRLLEDFESPFLVEPHDLGGQLRPDASDRPRGQIPLDAFG